MHDDGGGFFETDAGQFIAGAHRYISAARVLRFSETAETNGEMIKTPVLHLLAHGIELLLKYPLLRSGCTLTSIRAYGHDLKALWDSEENHRLRLHVLETAEEAWKEAEASGAWPNDDFSSDPRMLLPEQLGVLARLHGRETDFALRYTIKAPLEAPRSAFLIDAFGNVAEQTVMNPGNLDREP